MVIRLIGFFFRKRQRYPCYMSSSQQSYSEKKQRKNGALGFSFCRISALSQHRLKTAERVMKKSQVGPLVINVRTVFQVPRIFKSPWIENNRINNRKGLVWTTQFFFQECARVWINKNYIPFLITISFENLSQMFFHVPYQIQSSSG